MTSQTGQSSQIDQLFASGEVVDLHVNVGHQSAGGVLDGPETGEHVRRQLTASDLRTSQLGRIGLRTHYSRIEVPGEQPGTLGRFIPSVALNWTGIDPERVAQELQRFDHPHPIIWFQSFCDPYHRSVIDSAYRRSIAAAGAEERLVSHTDPFGRLTPETLAVLDVARTRGAIIATPHANWERTLPLIIQAADMGLPVLWVHPDSRLIRAPLGVQQAAVAYGQGAPGRGRVYIERAAVFLRDGKPGAYSAAQVVADVRAIGIEHIIFSSDLGRFKASDPLLPDAGLCWYMQQLHAVGLTVEEITTGLVANPQTLISGGSS